VYNERRIPHHCYGLVLSWQFNLLGSLQRAVKYSDTYFKTQSQETIHIADIVIGFNLFPVSTYYLFIVVNLHMSVLIFPSLEIETESIINIIIIKYIK
jgi:hypothetical protein